MADLQTGLTILFSVLIAIPLSNPAKAQQSTASESNVFVFLGDSITYSGEYVSIFESYWRQKNRGSNAEFINLGLMSETVSGLSERSHPFPRPSIHERLERVLKLAKPNLIVACYGINDGIYHPFNHQRFEKYKSGIRALANRVVESHCELVLLTPPPFDPEPLRKSGKLRSASATDFDWQFVFENYDSDVLAKYSRWLVEFGKESGLTVVDIRTPILRHLNQRRESDGKYALSPDGVHLNPVGHQIIANEIAKAFALEPEPKPNGQRIELLAKRQEILKLAWLKKIGHRRPGVPIGLSFTDAKQKAAELQNEIARLSAELASARTRIRLTSGWKFQLGKPTGNPSELNFDDSEWEEVSVPHTHRLYSEDLDGTPDNDWQKQWHRHVGWYRRELKIERRNNERVYLEFEGAHQVTDCWINGQHVGQHAIGGYTPFHFDITRFLAKSGAAIVALKVDNSYNPDIPPDFGRHDYIMPGGLYRDVYLVRTGQVRVTFPWESKRAGIFITTPKVSPDLSSVATRINIGNEGRTRQTGDVSIRITDPLGLSVAEATKTFDLAPADDLVLNFMIDVVNPKLWSIETPHLYQLETIVKTNQSENPQSKNVDNVVEKFGIRKLEFSKHGVRLNGKSIELIGANRHQQYPYIGNAVPDNLHYHDMWLLKQAGMNCVRLAHYPQDNAVLNACDDLGILVTEEPPTWIDTGSGQWIKNLESAQRRMIRNHRNHPSIFMWAAGINHLGYREFLQRAAEQEDPTRWTHANAAEWGENWDVKKGRATIYAEMGFRHASIQLKDDVQFTIEHSRGEMGRQQVASAKRRPEHLGLCVWEAFDNHSLKDKTGGSNLAKSGIIDLFRIPRDDYFWYQTELIDEPIIHLVNQKPDKRTPIKIFSNCDQIELTVNGHGYPKRGPDHSPDLEGLKSPPFTFSDLWIDGEIHVRGFRNGKLATEVVRKEPGIAQQLTLDFGLNEQREWPHRIFADGSSIVPVYARVRDRNGAIIRDSSLPVKLMIAGPAEIIGDSGSVNANPVDMRRGYAPFLLRTKTNPGTVVVTARSKTLQSTPLTFKTAICDD